MRLAGSLPQLRRWRIEKSSLDELQETAMRMMLRFTLPVEKSNAAINDGSLGRTMDRS